MPLFICCIALAAVTAVSLFWHAYEEARERRRRRLRDRVAYMLWVMADNEGPLPLECAFEVDSPADVT